MKYFWSTQAGAEFKKKKIFFQAFISMHVQVRQLILGHFLMDKENNFPGG